MRLTFWLRPFGFSTACGGLKGCSTASHVHSSCSVASCPHILCGFSHSLPSQSVTFRGQAGPTLPRAPLRDFKRLKNAICSDVDPSGPRGSHSAGPRPRPVAYGVSNAYFDFIVHFLFMTVPLGGLNPIDQVRQTRPLDAKERDHSTSAVISEPFLLLSSVNCRLGLSRQITRQKTATVHAVVQVTPFVFSRPS